MSILVASFTDAWIETLGFTGSIYDILSHLLQMRGLKPRTCDTVNDWERSHLLQMRGLKREDRPA